ncbi:MAG: hypothetical protein A2831_03300 [Candidatus Yanofskybacteria bacterium RIFCSPHIGHO2_01_FULL_44_17]|uniref:Uncharacterized protein n=1 Tax=Candidatus Yanofskybacteria bacterium RIFCSPHIGHO2_01_FULL_44_17 TaxID=1802668 RepID=A0A1F8EZE1_9BACT|nr:MAG: hypothetical protein A2831_03300 [Candidatus Yanofskybacteria bacterium RIFCSPHIGHO2_01_FULL_44_17]
MKYDTTNLVESTHLRTGHIAYYDDYRLESVLLPPFLSNVKTSRGRRWALRNPRQSRSSDSGAKTYIYILKARTKTGALAAAAILLGVKSVQFFDGKKVSRGYLVVKT